MSKTTTTQKATNEAYLTGLHTEAGDVLGDEKPAKKAPAKATKPAAEKLPSAAEMRKALVATGELTRDQVNAHKGADLKAAYENLVISRRLRDEKLDRAADALEKAQGKKTAKKAPAKKAPAKKAPAKKAPAAKKDDRLMRHFEQVFKGVPAGTFIKARDITNAVTKEFPKADARPSVHAVFSRCRGTNLPAGVTGQRVPCGATKTA